MSGAVGTATAGVLIIAAAAYFASNEHAGKQASELITAEATVQPIERTVLASGLLEPVKLVSVGARATGQVMKLHVKVGDTVKADQLIADIDSQPQRNALNKAEAALENVKAQRRVRQVKLRKAELVLTRERNLLQLDATPRNSYENALTERDALLAEIASLDAQIKQDGAAVQTARTDLSYTRITAPMSGVVVAVVTEEGRMVNANQSAPTIVMLADLSVIKVKAEISEADVTRAKPGQNVYFTVLSDPEKRYHAKLQSIEPAPASIASKAEQSTAGTSQQSAATKTAIYYNGLFEIPNPDGELYPLMTAQVHIVLDEARDVVTIPVTALGDRQPDGTRTVRVVDDRGKVAARPVQVGLNNGVRVQVVSGLQPGERVVIGDAASAIPSETTWGQ
ncbi:efflux RND transporter periplasmic adaptor subunit [Cupriavidus sp. CP313]